MRYRYVARRAVALTAAVVAVSVCAPVLASAAETSEKPDTHASYDAYRILLDRNIFVRNRRQPMPDRPDPRPTAYRPPTEPRLVLTGTARSGDSLLAFFEDRRTGETHRASVGKTLGGAVVQAITLDGAVIRDGETTRTIRIGTDLSGQAVALPRPATTTAATAPRPTASRGDEREDDRGGPPERPEDGGPPGQPRPEPQEAEPPADDDDADDVADILERMRQRREEELRR